MPERRNRNDLVFWIGLVWGLLFWVFAAIIASHILAMSLRGLLKGGIVINMAATAFVVTWFATVTAWVVAQWKARRLPSELRLGQLAGTPRPPEADRQSVWWWVRVGRYGLIAIIGFMALFVGFGIAGMFARE